ncbi:sulfotransferase domain-containing protein [Paractinoplanes rishiriensis]|uniref:Glycolipid sulfotransferase n=1 Tax=Paractinoplanes rishiriensis TaxID=1050105 RepID=A0A919K3K7_9ACTN|nr:sulfotransferase domain-containing protein [Actinoplanes rishiriensis]GIE98642.1 glycolipid sulfotransferase [Actinoplanes rishiriensis]
MRRYRSEDEDSIRWRDFRLRPGDVVISTRSKSGTTWMQMICALLVFQTPQLPARLTELSPWLDWLVVPQDQMFARLAAQQHRRFIKTHTPLDGVPIVPEVSYVVVARHPLDMAVSLYHQIDNIDRDRLRALTGSAAVASPSRPRPPVAEWLAGWVDDTRDPHESLDSLPGVLMHLTDAWQRRHLPNVRLVHYDDMLTDLAGTMRSLAEWLGISVPSSRWPELIRAATFTEMRRRADELTPNQEGVLRDNRAFFREGRSRAGRELLGATDYARYERIVAELAPADLVRWLHLVRQA